MSRTSSMYRGGGGFGGGLTGPMPKDLWILVGIVLATFSLRFFSATAWLPSLLELSPDVWQRGFLWQLATYPFVGDGGPGFWFVIELAIVLLFARDVFWRLGRREFWRLLVGVTVGAGIVAATIGALGEWVLGAAPTPQTLSLLQGQRALLTVLIAAFATLNGRAVIRLFFVLPIEARWFLGIEILFAFLGFLSTKDFAGFVGVVAGVGLAYLWLSPGSWRSKLREPWLRLQEAWIRVRLRSMGKRSGLRIVPSDDGQPKSPEPPGSDRWVN